MEHGTADTGPAVVAGDVTIEWCLADRGTGGARLTPHPGGAALLTLLLTGAVEALGVAVLGPRLRDGPSSPGDPSHTRSFSVWAELPRARGQDSGRAWRVREAVGIDPGAAPGAPVPPAATPSLVVLDDAGLGFRDGPEGWSTLLDASPTCPLLARTAWPVGEGPLFAALADRAERVVAVVELDDLRRTDVELSRELSWERTAQDLFWELRNNPRVNALARFSHVVVSIGAAGALLLSGGSTRDARCTLVFDPGLIEGEWEEQHPGKTIGSGACMTAALGVALATDPAQPDLVRAIRGGLAAARRLHLDGWSERVGDGGDTVLTFPLEQVAAELREGGGSFVTAQVDDPAHRLPARGEGNRDGQDFWTILADRYPGDLAEVARQIALEGPEEALEGVPLGRFGALLTVDRHEIEALRSIRSLIREYRRQGRQKRPLSIAVFGPPGAGKSFGVVQIATAVLPGEVEVVELNVSQWRSGQDLVDALHRVRDVGLGGKVPLVFWDEFDSAREGEPLGWLRSFLGPMQDGRFQEGQITHPIGGAIFVFAGGTAPRLDAFGRDLEPAAFRAAKGPDFVSRLKGFVNVLGPNPQRGDAGEEPADPFFVVRRAILLRSILERSAPQLFERRDGRRLLHIDPGVLRAFLLTREYRHGARSLESIVATSLLSGATSYQRSSLPAEAQLDLHVDGRDFLALVQQLELEGELLDRLAEAAHETFCDGLRRRGYTPGEETDEAGRTHRLLRPYAELPEADRLESRANVRDIPAKLAGAGYVMLPARSDEPPFTFPADDLERLSEAEHERFVAAKLAAGWAYAPETDRERRLHEALVPWSELPETQREKDRDLVRGIPEILARAGYTVLRSRR